MTRTIDIPHGKRYIIERCPYCGRRLAEWYEGTSVVSVLHPKAGIVYSAGIEFSGKDEMYYAGYPPHPVEGTSHCLRIICRLRRRLGRNHWTPEVSP